MTNNTEQINLVGNQVNLRDKLWRMNHLYRIIDKKGVLTTFTLNEAQVFLFNALQKHPRQLTPKARQLGISTFYAIYMLDDVLFRPYYTAVIIAHEYKAMKKIFEKIQIAWQEFPQPIKDFFKWEVRTDNKEELKFNNYSSISVALSSRGGTVSHLHISELGSIAKEYPDKLNEILTGAMPSVTPDGKITIESTVEEPAGYFRELVDKASPTTPNNRFDYQLSFFPWTNDKAYTTDSQYLYSELPQSYLDYQKQYNLTDGQICWYWKEKVSSGLSDQKWQQQFPTTLDEAFSASIDNFFNLKNVQFRKINDTTAPIRHVNGWDFYDTYNKNHRYGMGVDVGEGIKRDSSTAVIIDFSHKLANYQIVPKVVATFQSNTVDPVEFAQVLIDGAVQFGNPIIAVERNNVGIATLSKLKENYFNIYKQKMKDYVEDREVERYGWLTTSSTKPEILANLRIAVDDSQIIIPALPVLKELEVYGVEDYQTMKKQSDITRHFDLVMALAICYEMRNHATGGYNQEPEYVTEPMDSSSRFFQV